MYVSWRWISEMVDTVGIDPVVFVDRFVLAVAEIEGVRHVGPGLEAVRVGRVVAVQPHPGADKLRLVDVDLGETTVRVVCGAPDVRVGMWVPFVPPGVTLPSGIEVRDGEVRGERSPGMLASERDLGLSDENAGLLDLDGCAAVAGAALLDAVPLADTLYEIDNKSLTHRPDLWGHLGIAREIAALLNRPLMPPLTTVAWGEGDPLAGGVMVADDAAGSDGGCLRYLAAAFTGIVVAPSPVAVRLRLRSLGVRPISNVVDATNLVMLETGNPLHAFDARALEGDRIVVRRARAGETLRTLDGTARALTVDDVVIADADNAVALAGIMGGGDSEIRADSANVVLEAANFDGARVRKTSSRLGLRSESSARFEKSLDPALAATAAHRFAVVLQQLCPSARPASRLCDEGPVARQRPALPVITTTRGYLRQRLGLSAVELSDTAIDDHLGRLGFVVEGALGAPIAVTVPSFRAGRDVSLDVDLVEELGRHYGYDRIGSDAPLAAVRPAPLPPMRRLERQLRAICALGRGLSEVHLYSFDHEPTRARLRLAAHDANGAELPRLYLRNSLSSEHVALRRELGGGLLAALERNLTHGTQAATAQKGLRIGIFELGRGYLSDRVDADGVLAATDNGLPPVLANDRDSAAAAGFLRGLGPALAVDALAACASARPLPREPRRLALAIGERVGGAAAGGEVEAPPEALTVALWRQAVGAVEAIFAGLGVSPPLLRRGDRGENAATMQLASGLDAAPGWLHPARHAHVLVDHGGVLAGGDGRLVDVGLVSMLHPQARAALEVPAEVVIVELDVDALLALMPRQRVVREPTRLPATTFDVTVPLRGDVGADIARTVVFAALARDEATAAIVEQVSVEGVWRDVARAVEAADTPHSYAVTLRVRLRRADQTVRDSEAVAARAITLAALDAWRDGAVVTPVAHGWADALRAAAGDDSAAPTRSGAAS